MKRRIPESWLSAYLDGELAADRAALVADLAAKRPAVAKRLDELRRVKAAVASLPKVKLAGDNRRRLWEAVLGHPELQAARRQAVAASMDGELSPEQSALLEATLTDDELQAAAKLAEVRDALRELPKFLAPTAVVARAMDEIRAEAVASLEAAAELATLPTAPAPADLLEQTVCELKPVAPPPSFRLFALRREGWVSGLAAALLTGVALFTLTAPPAPNKTTAENAPRQATGKAPEPPMFGGVPDAPKPAPPTPVPPRNDPPQSIAQQPGDVPTLDDPFIDDRWMPLPPEPKVVATGTPKGLLDLLRPGASIDVPGTKITFLCLDVRKMADRVQVVLMKNAVPDRDIRTTEEKDGTLVSVEVAATPGQLAAVLQELKNAEEANPRLIADVEVFRPKSAVANAGPVLVPPPPIANVGVDARPLETPKPALPLTGPGAKVAEGPPMKAPASELDLLPADKPRPYVLVFRRQEVVPRTAPGKS